MIKIEIISIFNGKGGTGKSTITAELFSMLTKAMYRVLLIDLDEQFDSSYLVGADLEGKTIYDTLMTGLPLAESMQEVAPMLGWVVPGSPDMGSLDMDLYGEKDPLYRLNNALTEVLEQGMDFDYILIDCPPHAGLAVLNAMAISDSVIVPVQSEVLAIKAAQLTNRNFEKIKEKVNPDLRIRGLILSRHDRRSNAAKAGEITIEKMAQELDTKLLGAVRDSARVFEAQAQRKTVTDYAPHSTVAEDFKTIFHEFMKGQE